MAKQKQRTVLASAARTASTDTEIAFGGNSGLFIVNVTAISATPSVVFTIEGIDPATGTKYNILTSAAVTATGQTVLRVFPGATASTNLVANDFLPDNINLNIAHADADSITYSVAFIGF